MKKWMFILLLIPFLVVGQNVKQLELDDVNGDTFVLSDNLNHDATIISFWATWCLPCQKEHPALQAMKEKLKDKDIQILAISTDSPRSLAKVKKYVRSHKYDFVFLLDPSGEFARELLVTDIPYTIVLNKNGDVVFTHSGYRKGDELELEKELMKLWQEKK